MPKKKKVEVEALNIFVCCEKEFTPKEVIEHLEKEHGIAKGTEGTRSMTLHIDGKDFYSSQYVWQFGNLKLTQIVREPRSNGDLMRYFG